MTFSQSFAELMLDGNRFRHRYKTKTPYPYAWFENAFDRDVAMAAFKAWPKPDHPAWGTFEKGKTSRLKRGAFDCDQAPEEIAVILDALNSNEFVRFLEDLTGVESLMPDDLFRGAGPHETMPGGFLAKHVDFNRLRTPYAGDQDSDPYRRLNVFLYLNPEWSVNWGGELCLWRAKEGITPDARIEPRFNRLVICEASERSWHGHPKPLACPAGYSRKSIAAYYYTQEPPLSFKKRHSTVYVKGK